MLKAWLELARISNLPTAWTNVLAGWLLAGGQLQDQRLLWLLFGASLLYSGGMILNDAADAGYDREHRKERPIPRGAVSVGAAWGGGMLCLMIGGNLCSVFGGASVGSVGLLCAAILAYDLYHKPWAGSVIIMGACRTLLYLTAASAAIHGFSNPEAVLVSRERGALLLSALAIGLYIIGLTKMARLEALGDKARVRRIVNQPVLLFVPAAAALLMYSVHHDARVLALVAGFLWMAITAIRIMRRGGSDIGRAVGILLAGIAVVDGLAVATVSFPLACAFCAIAPLLRLWQRKIAAT